MFFIKNTFTSTNNLLKFYNINFAKYTTASRTHNTFNFIMGCDALVDFLPNSKKIPIEDKYKLLSLAYEHGIKTFDVSVCPNFIQAFKKLKNSSKGDITGIGNPNWKCGFKLNGIDLWDIQDRIRITLLERYFNNDELSFINRLPKWSQDRWFMPINKAYPLDENEIKDIYLDKDQLLYNLFLLKNEVSYVVFGSNYLDWLTKLDRLDLIEQALYIIKEMGFIPMSISHFPSVVAPVLNSLPFEGHWIHFNKLEQLIIPNDAVKYTSKLIKPITAFRVLSAGMLANHPKESIEFVQNKLNPSNIVIGINSSDEIFFLAENYYKATSSINNKK